MIAFLDALDSITPLQMLAAFLVLLIAGGLLVAAIDDYRFRKAAAKRAADFDFDHNVPPNARGRRR